jgi:hypothetical protein
MWSKAERENSSAEKCAEIKEKSGLSNRKDRILWTKAAKSISPTGVRFCFCVQDKPDSNAFE